MTSKNKFILIMGVSLLLGFVAGLGSAAGWFAGLSWPAFLDMQLLSWLVRLVIVLLFFLTLSLLRSSRRILSDYQAAEEDEELSDELYRKMLRNLEYGTLSFNALASLIIFDMISTIIRNSSGRGGSYFLDLLPLGLLCLLYVIQSYLLKTIELVRNYKLPMIAMPSDVLNFIKTYDEGEMMANYERSFRVLFQLNQIVLPLLYVLLYAISLVTGQLQLVGLLLVAFIHIYINLAQLPMIKKYFR